MKGTSRLFFFKCFFFKFASTKKKGVFGGVSLGEF